MTPYRACAALWWTWFAVWMWAARGAKAPERRESRLSRLTHYLPLGAGCWLLFGVGALGPLESRVLPEAAAWPGVVLTAAGIAFSFWARFHLGRNWSGEVQLKKGHELVRTGPYALARNPIYTGLLLGVLGTAAAIGRARGFVGALLVLAAFLRKIAIEEGVLAAEFGPAYDAYRREVKALVPFVW